MRLPSVIVPWQAIHLLGRRHGAVVLVDKLIELIEREVVGGLAEASRVAVNVGADGVADRRRAAGGFVGVGSIADLRLRSVGKFFPAWVVDQISHHALLSVGQDGRVGSVSGGEFRAVGRSRRW